MPRVCFILVASNDIDARILCIAHRYDPVFLVETVDGRKVWCKRHYKCSPRRGSAPKSNESSSSGTGEPTPGLWTFTTLDNGVASRELWTIVDAADDLEWVRLCSSYLC